MGYLRFFLALLITISHLGQQPSQLPAHETVFVFYAVSSFFCTQAVAERYQGKPAEFLLKRLRRLLPMFWLALGLSAALVYSFDLSELQRQMTAPSLIDLLRGAAMSTERSIAHPVPQAWMLGVMLFWWVMIAFGAFKTRDRTILCAGAALVLNQSFYVAYGSLLFGFLPFALGASAYWLGLRLPRTTGLNRWCEQVSYPLFLFHYFAAGLLWALFDIKHGLALGLISAAFVIIGYLALQLVTYGYRRLNARAGCATGQSRSA